MCRGLQVTCSHQTPRNTLIPAGSFNIIGKKWSLVLLSLPFITGWLLLYFALSSVSFIIGRFLTGFAGGAFVLAAPAYIAEIAETKYRGALGTLMCLMCGLGILFINLNCSTHFRGTLTAVQWSSHLNFSHSKC